jgi:hypothetical protein
LERNGIAESDNILTKLQDLLLYLIPQLNKFPRPERKLTGRSLVSRGFIPGNEYAGVSGLVAGPPANAPMTARDLMGEARAPLILPAS